MKTHVVLPLLVTLNEKEKEVAKNAFFAIEETLSTSRALTKKVKESTSLEFRNKDTGHYCTCAFIESDTAENAALAAYMLGMMMRNLFQHQFDDKPFSRKGKKVMPS